MGWYGWVVMGGLVWVSFVIEGFFVESLNGKSLELILKHERKKMKKLNLYKTLNNFNFGNPKSNNPFSSHPLIRSFI